MEVLNVKRPLLLLALLPLLSQAADLTTPPAAPETAQAQAHATRYVSDNLYTFLHGGPGKQYRILGSIKAGDAVQFLALSDDGKYSQIIDPKGRTAWIASESLQSGESFKILAPKLQQKLDALQHTLDNLDSEQARQIKEQVAELSQLKQQNQEQAEQLQAQSAKLSQLHTENQTLKSQLDTREQDAQYRWWREGAIIAGVGLLLGLLLPWLPRPQRRRKDRWMN